MFVLQVINCIEKESDCYTGCFVTVTVLYSVMIPLLYFPYFFTKTISDVESLYISMCTFLACSVYLVLKSDWKMKVVTFCV